MKRLLPILLIMVCASCSKKHYQTQSNTKIISVQNEEIKKPFVGFTTNKLTCNFSRNDLINYLQRFETSSDINKQIVELQTLKSDTLIDIKTTQDYHNAFADLLISGKVRVSENNEDKIINKIKYEK